MPSVEILIPASPVAAFFSQIAAFSWALKSLRWSRWQPALRVVMGGDVDTQALERWLPFLGDVEIVLLSRVQSRREGIWAQYDSLYQIASKDADVILRMDADTLPVSDFEDVLDRVMEIGGIAGVIEHYPFSAPGGLAQSEDWQRLATDVIGRPLDLCFRYTLLPDPERPAPFYLNDGAVYCSGKIFPELSRHYLRLRPRLVHRLTDPYFAGQVGFALAVAELGAPTWALPARYNFPNDERAASLHQDELARVAVFHYLRTEKFDRHKIFRDAAEYGGFIERHLTGVDAVFQKKVREIFGVEYPFGDAGSASGRADRGARRPGQDALSNAAFERETAQQRALVAPELTGIDSEIAGVLPSEDRAVAEPPVSASVAALDFAAQFDASGHLEPLMRFKQALVAEFGVERGFAAFRARIKLPDSGQIRLSRLGSQYTFSRAHGEVFVETDRGGDRFVIEPPRVIGDGIRRPLEHVARPLFVACVKDARVRGRSAVVEIGNLALLDYQDGERELFDSELDIDPAIFHAAADEAWLFVPQNDLASIDVAEAFSLLGPNSGAFGDWMLEFLPRYLTADLSGCLPRIPVLVDAQIPESIHRCIEMMIRPGVEIIKVPAYVTVRVGRLWYASNLHYAPAFDKMEGRWRWDYLCPSPAQLMPAVREIARRADAALSGRTSSHRGVFLGRRPHQWRRLVNYVAIEAAARERGFQIVYPEDLSFDCQVDLIRHADYVVALLGSALFLLYFARPGTKLCTLVHTSIDEATSYNGLFDGIDMTVVTGSIVQPDLQFSYRSDYEIDEKRFCDFLDDWLADNTADTNSLPIAAKDPDTPSAGGCP
jgi:capsular polysaccharide biosynthesis protein